MQDYWPCIVLDDVGMQHQREKASGNYWYSMEEAVLFLLNPHYWRAVNKRVYHGSTTYSCILLTVAFSGFSLWYRATDIPRLYLGTNRVCRHQQSGLWAGPR